MPTIAATASRAAASTDGFDAFLGPASDRYLGGGHRRVALLVEPLVRTARLQFSTEAQVEYPEDWSQKGGKFRVPHLSTVDAIRIASEVCVELQASWHDVLPDFAFEERLTVRAGAHPWERLDRVPVQTSLMQSDHGQAVTIRHEIGSLKVESRMVRSDTPHRVNEPWQAGRASNIQFGPGPHVLCDYTRTEAPSAAMPLLEALTLAAQMAQVALYGGEPQARDRSGNLWMRRAAFVRKAFTPEQVRTAAVALTLHDRRTVALRGRLIETAEVRAHDVFGIQVTASLATAS